MMSHFEPTRHSWVEFCCDIIHETGSTVKCDIMTLTEEDRITAITDNMH